MLKDILVPGTEIECKPTGLDEWVQSNFLDSSGWCYVGGSKVDWTRYIVKGTGTFPLQSVEGMDPICLYCLTVDSWAGVYVVVHSNLKEHRVDSYDFSGCDLDRTQLVILSRAFGNDFEENFGKIVASLYS